MMIIQRQQIPINSKYIYQVYNMVVVVMNERMSLYICITFCHIPSVYINFKTLYIYPIRCTTLIFYIFTSSNIFYTNNLFQTHLYTEVNNIYIFFSSNNIYFFFLFCTMWDKPQALITDRVFFDEKI